MNPVRGFAEVNGTRLFYESTGSGPAVVFLHGFTLDHRMWDDQVAAFSTGYRVIRYDLRGFGKSAVPEAIPYAHHEDLRALLDFLGVSRAHVVGLSVGGSYAVDFAIAHPARASALVLVDAAALGGFMWPQQLADWFTGIRATARQGNLVLAKQRWLATDWFQPARRLPGVAACLDRMVADYSGWHFTHDNPVQGLSPPANQRLHEIQAPALVLVGELDLPFYNHPLADRLASGIPGAQKLVIPNAGHLASMEAPDAFNGAVLGFFAGLSPPPGQ